MKAKVAARVVGGLMDEIYQLRAELEELEEKADIALKDSRKLTLSLIKAEADLARRDERVAELEAMINQSDFDKYLVSKLKNPQLAEEFARVRIADKALHEIVEKQTNIISRLKEDADALYYSILHQEFGETKYQSRAVDAHRALMKELE